MTHDSLGTMQLAPAYSTHPCTTRCFTELLDLYVRWKNYINFTLIAWSQAPAPALTEGHVSQVYPTNGKCITDEASISRLVNQSCD
jgi:hypothetical protein